MRGPGDELHQQAATFRCRLLNGGLGRNQTFYLFFRARFLFSRTTSASSLNEFRLCSSSKGGIWSGSCAKSRARAAKHKVPTHQGPTLA